MCIKGEERRKIDNEWMTLEECYLKYHKLIWVGVKKASGSKVLTEYDIDDLMSEGNIALILAYRRYDNSKGYKFSTYLVSTVWGYVMRYYRDRYGLVRSGRANADLRGKIGRDLYELTVKEIVDKYKVNEKEVEQLKLSNLGVYSLDYEYSEDGNIVTMKDIIEGEGIDNTLFIVNEFINSLDIKYRDILVYVLEGYNQVEIGKRVRKSQAQVSRDIKKLGDKYREWEKREEIRGYN